MSRKGLYCIYAYVSEACKKLLEQKAIAQDTSTSKLAKKILEREMGVSPENHKKQLRSSSGRTK